MALVSDLMGLGMPGPLANKLGNVPATIAGIGTSQATASLITTSMPTLTTGSGQTAFVFNSNTSLTRLYFVFNSSATTALLFTPAGTGGSFNGGSVDASFSLAQNKTAIIWRVSTTQWNTLLTA